MEEEKTLSWKRMFPNEKYLAIGVSRFDGGLFITGDSNMSNYDNPHKWNGRATLAIPFNEDADMNIVKQFVCNIFEAKEDEVVDRTCLEYRDYEEINWYDKNSKVVIFMHIVRIVIEIYQLVLMFTLVDNYDFEKHRVKDINLAEELPQLENYEKAKAYLVEKYGFAKDNISGEQGEKNVKYNYKRFS